MKSWLFTSLLATALLSVSMSVFAEDCEQGQQHYLQGLTKGKFHKWAEARDLLAKSVSMCNRFNNWYLLGQAHFELAQYDEAASAFEDAKRFATEDNERAIAIARYAQVHASQGMVNQPLSLLREASKMHSNAPQWMLDLTRKLDEKRVSQPLTIAQVTGALTNKSIKLFNLQAQPSLDISINFEFDSTKVVQASESSVDVLAKALMENSLREKSVTIVGHSDNRGSDSYNEKLSQQRAKSIAAMLYKQYPELKGRITIEGKGEKQPPRTPGDRRSDNWSFPRHRAERCAARRSSP